VSAPLNLARHPFRNERLPTLLLGLGTLALAVATVRHSMVAWRLLPGHAQDLQAEVQGFEAETAQLTAQAAALREASPPADTLKEWAAVKRLVDRRAFSWTGLFAALEQALPPGVRLVSVQPSREGSGRALSLHAVGRSSEDALALLKALQAHGDFTGAFLNGWTQGREGVDISCSVRYEPKTEARR
jgi:Tfp pilus assembly protein PilN